MNKLKQRGFTLIEVVIVLAIGAVIILVVLQQVASAQRNQRNSARRSEASRIVSLLETHASSNNGMYPANPAAARAAINTRDQVLSAKYPAANWVADTYEAPIDANPSDDLGASVCPAVNATTYAVVYAVSGNQRDYRLAGCLETATDIAEMVVVK